MMKGAGALLKYFLWRFFLSIDTIPGEVFSQGFKKIPCAVENSQEVTSDAPYILWFYQAYLEIPLGISQDIFFGKFL